MTTPIETQRWDGDLGCWRYERVAPRVRRGGVFRATFRADVPAVAFGVEVVTGAIFMKPGAPLGRAGFRCEVWRDEELGGWGVRVGRNQTLHMDDDAAKAYLRTDRDKMGRPVEITDDSAVMLDRGGYYVPRDAARTGK